MSNSAMLDKTLLVFDGAQKDELKFKGEFSFANEKFVRDLTQRTATELSVHDPENIIEPLDLFYIPNYLGMQIIGRIDNVNNIDDHNNFKKIKLYYGADVFTNEIYLANNSLVPNLSIDNNQTLTLSINTSKPVTTSNNFLDFDTLCRQAMRGILCSEKPTFTNSRLFIDITEKTSGVNEFSIEEPELTSKKIVFADDQYNVLRLYNADNKSQSQTYYLGTDGTVSTNIANAQYPNVVKYEVVEAVNYNNLSFATSKIKQQEYNNLIEFEMPFSTNIKALKFDNTFLGRKVRVWFKDGTKIDTIISKYEIKNNLSVKCSLGLTRTKLTEQLKKEA